VAWGAWRNLGGEGSDGGTTVSETFMEELMIRPVI
jgi:hypothetical protein